ncbi:MAG TPA: hypothetical protein VFU59_03535 [Candidatus Eisenbacteria bacterium]|nr:hypothetical protein [Candidatus Eisenbacteria bacterium]
MPRRKTVRAGLLIVLVLAGSLSCGENTPTEPALASDIIAPALSENFETSPLRESRELLIDGRATDIEWNGTGDPAFVIARGDGGNFFVLVRSLWTFDARTNAPRGIYFELQWPDREENRLEEPLTTTLDTGNADGVNQVDCTTDLRVVNPGNWRRADIHEDQVFIEIYSDSLGNYPADAWRWGAGTTDPAVPVNPTEYQGADFDETRGAADHPLGGSVEDFYSTGGAWAADIGRLPNEANVFPGSDLPLYRPNKATRDVRLNRGKPTSYIVWKPVASLLTECDTLNPLRVDDASVRDKTWNPGDYIPSVTTQLPDSSQSDVVARGTWLDGKWALEIRRELTTRPPDVQGIPQPPRPDDIILQEGRRYRVRFTFYNATKTRSSQTELLPLYLKPRN